MFENVNVKKIGIIAGIIFLLVALCSSIEVVDQGNRGLLVNRGGDDKGRAIVQEKSGWVFVTPFMQKLYEYPVYQQHKEYPPLAVLAKGGLQFTVTPKFNYQLNLGYVGETFQKFRQPISIIEEAYMKTAVEQTFRDVTNAFDPDSLINNRTQYEVLLNEVLTKKLAPYFSVSQVTSGLTPPKSLIDAIEAKAKAVQDAQTAENQKRVIVAEGEKQLAQAHFDSASRLTRAHAIANENDLYQRSLTPLLIEKMRIEAWQKGGSQVPTTVLGGGGAQFLMQLPGTKK